MIKCEIDGKEFKNGGVLARYLKQKYKITYQQYYHQYIIKTDDIPKCSCGCGELCDWANGIGYRKYKQYHHIRVKNPWGHNSDAIKKSIETRRKQYASGERKTWCYGLKKKIHRLYNPLQKSYLKDIHRNYENNILKKCLECVKMEQFLL
jgi:hypothetical protein